MSSVIMYKNFDSHALACGELTKNRAGGNQVALKYNENKQIIMQTPIMSAPFGLSEYTPENGSGPVKYSLDLSFKGYDENIKLSQFLKTLADIDNQMIDLAVTNSRIWFGKQMSPEVVKELYRPLVKESKNPEKYAPTIKFKIRPSRTMDGHFNLEAFTSNRETFNMSDFQPGSSVKCIVEFSPIWFVNKQFGITLNLMQLEVTSLPIGKLQGFAFQDEDESDGEEISDVEM